jgi:Rrf2 family transcriptional repressor of oqxAB
MVDVRFASALQAMLSLALAQREGADLLTSSELAAGLATNPSLVRRLTAPLLHAGLLVSAKGKLGGLALAKPAREITLADVYRATLRDKKLLAARECVPHRCVVSTNLEPFLAELSSEMEDAVLAGLGARTLADALAELDEADRLRAGRGSKRASRTQTREATGRPGGR